MLPIKARSVIIIRVEAEMRSRLLSKIERPLEFLDLQSRLSNNDRDFLARVWRRLPKDPAEEEHWKRAAKNMSFKKLSVATGATKVIHTFQVDINPNNKFDPHSMAEDWTPEEKAVYATCKGSSCGMCSTKWHQHRWEDLAPDGVIERFVFSGVCPRCFKEV